MPKMRHAEATRDQLSLLPHAARAAHRTVITLGDLVTAAYRVAGTAEGTARLLGQQSPLGHMIDRRLVFG
jgi:hypothetical protein